MTDSQSLGLSPEQKELILRGLRFVRSAISMELCDPSDQSDARRAAQLREVDSLVRELNGQAEAVAV